MKITVPYFFGFGLVRFLNAECDAGNGFTGTCYTRRECNILDGSRASKCANDAGSCCVCKSTLIVFLFLLTFNEQKLQFNAPVESLQT